MEEAELLALLREDPEEGMGQVLDRYGGLVYAVCRSKLPGGTFDPADVEDCAAATFGEFYRDLDRYSPEKGSIRSWLCVMARHNALDLLRRRGGERAALPLEEDLPADCTLESDLEDRELRAAVIRAVETLDEPNREIVIRKFYLSQPSKTIGERLGMTVANVDTRTHRAVEKLREMLIKGGNTP